MLQEMAAMTGKVRILSESIALRKSFFAYV